MQIHLVSQLPQQFLRIDLLLPLMFGVAMEWSPLTGLLWACLWGYIADVFSGEFWGFHVVSYVIAVCLVNIAVEKFEFHNPFYQMCFVGACALGQSLILGLFLLFQPASPFLVLSTWHSLTLRSIVTALISPLLIYPVWNTKKFGI